MTDDNILDFPEKKKKKKPRKKPILVSGLDVLVGSYNIIDHFFFSPGGDMLQICTVLVEEQNGKYVVAYMGTGVDKQWVASWGAKLTRQQAESIFRYKMPNYKKG